jgi:adenylate kinase family enzyme
MSAIAEQLIIFIGPESSGKTNHGKNLAKKIDRPYVSTSAIIRHHADHDRGPVGDECRAMYAANAYLSGETLLGLLTNRLRGADVQAGCVLDGGLRTLPETKKFPQALIDANMMLPLSIMYLHISREEAFDVAMYRLVTGPNARKRHDDTAQGVTSRLNEYFFQLEERLAIIQENPNWHLHQIDARLSESEVYSQVLSYFGIS